MILVFSNAHNSNQVEAFSEMDLPDISKLVYFSIENMNKNLVTHFHYI